MAADWNAAAQKNFICQEENIEYYGVYGNISGEQTHVSDREETTVVKVKHAVNIPDHH